MDVELIAYDRNMLIRRQKALVRFPLERRLEMAEIAEQVVEYLSVNQ